MDKLKPKIMTDYEEKEYGDPVITFQLKNWETSKGSTWYESCAEAIDELVKDVIEAVVDSDEFNSWRKRRQKQDHKKPMNNEGMIWKSIDTNKKTQNNEKRLQGIDQTGIY